MQYDDETQQYDFFRQLSEVSRLYKERGPSDEVRTALGALSDCVTAEGSAQFGFDDLAGLELTEEPQPTIMPRSDGRALLYPGKTHTIVAEPGAGKSWLAAKVAVDEARKGQRVLYIDFEDDAKGYKWRCVKLDASDDLFSEHLYYKRYDAMYNFAAFHAWVMQMIEAFEFSVVVWDGLAQSQANAGIEENSNSESSAFISRFIRPMALAGPAVLVLDHVGKASTAPGMPAPRYARGASSKLGDVTGVQYFLRKVQAFNRETPGTGELIVSKDRPGGVAAPDGEVVAQIVYTPHDGGKRFTIDINAPAVGQRLVVSEEDKHIRRQYEVWQCLGKFGDLGANATHIASEMSIRKQDATEALKLLAASGHVRAETGARGRIDYFAVLDCPPPSGFPELEEPPF
jgi:AAA domain